MSCFKPLPSIYPQSRSGPESPNASSLLTQSNQNSASGSWSPSTLPLPFTPTNSAESNRLMDAKTDLNLSLDQERSTNSQRLLTQTQRSSFLVEIVPDQSSNLQQQQQATAGEVVQQLKSLSLDTTQAPSTRTLPLNAAQESRRHSSTFSLQPQAESQAQPQLPPLPQPSTTGGTLPPILRAPSSSSLTNGSTRSSSITSLTPITASTENQPSDQTAGSAGAGAGAASAIPFPLKNTKKGKSGVVQDYGIEADISVLNKVLLCQKNRSPLNPADYYPLLPVMRCRRNRMTLVLDLDETLVHASSKPRLGVKYDTVIQVKDEKGAPAGLVHVAYRPHLHQFLRTVARAFEIVVFTASLSSYASPLLDQLDPMNEIISYRLYREHCVEVNGAKVKDLSLLGRPLDRVAIIDNSPVAYLFQPRNAIPIRSWFEDPHDTDLLVLLHLLTRLSQETTTYPVLDMYNAHLISLSLTPSP